tara:strand:- start:161 stop:583 length:423 start_codon:yes stop_codon:yes gene_type:complete
MFIERMNKGSWGKIRAFFDLRTEEGFTIKGFKLVEGANGLFVGFPSQKGHDGEYRDTIWAIKDLKLSLKEIASRVYNSDDGVKCQDNYSECEAKDVGERIGGIRLIRGDEASNMTIDKKAADYQERVEDSQQDPDEDIPF